MTDNRIRHMFPGNNTSQGFFSYFASILPQARAERIYCLKGGPGVGKSTFLKRIGKRMAQEGFDLEYLHCASDPNSLDALVIPALGVALIDGTAPHVTDPVYPAAVDEIVNLGEFWDSEGIQRNRNEIIRVNTEIGRHYRRAFKYLGAAGYLRDDIIETYEFAANQAGPRLEAQRVIDNELKRFPLSEHPGNTRRLFAEAVTPSGIVHHLESLTDSAEKVYSVKNLWGVGVHELLENISSEAVSRGLDVELYYSPFAPRTHIDHLLIPALKLSFVSENHSFKPEENWLTLDMTQYTDLSQTEPQKDSLAFDEATFRTLLDKAIHALSGTKKLHDELEGYYIPHMDFERVDQKEQEICRQILALANRKKN